MKLTARSHAFVYGVIAQTALEMDSNLKDSLIEGIITYGNQRGSRMAQLAIMRGKELSMKHYLAFGEWAPAPGEMDVEIPESSPSAVWHVKKCPWNTEWKEKNMLNVGELYCAYVDVALVKGFNNDLELGIDTNQSKGDEYCYFKWHGADMNEENVKDNMELQKIIGKERIRTWEYHCGHIYKTLFESLEKNIGRKEVINLYHKIDEKIEKELGQKTVDMLHSSMLIDFWKCPVGKNTDLLEELF